jgi:hypothetical protein
MMIDLKNLLELGGLWVNRSIGIRKIMTWPFGDLTLYGQFYCGQNK